MEEIIIGTATSTRHIDYTPDTIDRYEVIVKLPEYWEEIHNYIINENEIDGIPNRKIECADGKDFSKRSAIYSMSVEEVEVLRKHPKVDGVWLDPNKFPQPQETMELTIQCAGDDPVRWHKNVAFQKNRLMNSLNSGTSQSFAPTTHTNGVRCNWSHMFAITCDSTPFRGVGVTNKETHDADITFTQNGRGVDAVILDTGTSVLHPDLIAADGTYRVRDVILDGPYKVDPEFFDADPTNRLETVTIDGVNIGTRAKESVARAWWGNTGTSYRSSKFSGVGTKSISSSYTRQCAHSKNNTDGSGYRITSGHGTACASQIGGKWHGLAIECNIWSIHVNLGTNTPTSASTGLDICTIWHKAKKVASDDPDPTILNNSWGSSSTLPYSNGTSYTYTFRGSSKTYTGNGSPIWTLMANSGPCGHHASQIARKTNGTSYKLGWWGKYEPYAYDSNSSNVAAEDAIDNGVIVAAASGNNNCKLADYDDPDFNNAYSGSYINRTGSVQQGFYGDSNHSRLNGTIRVGALDCAVEPPDEKQGVDAYSIRQTAYSNNGPMITIWAPSQDSLAAGYADYEDHAREDDSNYYDTWFSGTSSACPNAVSLICLYLQSHRDATQTDVMNWLDTEGSKEIALSDPYTSGADSSGDPEPNYWHNNYSSSTDLPNTLGDSYNRRGSGNLRGATKKVIYNPYVGAGTTGPQVDVLQSSGISFTHT